MNEMIDNYISTTEPLRASSCYGHSHNLEIMVLSVSELVAPRTRKYIRNFGCVHRVCHGLPKCAPFLVTE